MDDGQCMSKVWTLHGLGIVLYVSKTMTWIHAAADDDGGFRVAAEALTVIAIVSE